ncbi:MAG TPA: heme ABC exporter ATP-binding protein CcmA [Gemmatimonadales bacterium]|jgi:heme exporter protein A|nr:heme ABC exporter ATP-binding protein CcmA [Gemmatimonadales bacterium]
MPSSDGAGGPALLDARGLRRSFGGLRVLRGVDLQVRAGEAVVVAGPNGAGKTTLLRLLAGLMRPEAGEVRVLGRPVRGDGEAGRRPIGFVSHQSLLYDDLTLQQNLTFAARLYGVAHPAAAARAALAAAGLASRADDSPRRLSRGLTQRAAIARALLHQPSLLLLDEPFTALDAAAAERLRADLVRRLAAGLGMVIVTHRLGEVWSLASRIAVLAEGEWACDEPHPGALETFLPRYHGLVGA